MVEIIHVFFNFEKKGKKRRKSFNKIKIERDYLDDTRVAVLSPKEPQVIIIIFFFCLFHFHRLFQNIESLEVKKKIWNCNNDWLNDWTENLT